MFPEALRCGKIERRSSMLLRHDGYGPGDSSWRDKSCSALTGSSEEMGSTVSCFTVTLAGLVAPFQGRSVRLLDSEHLFHFVSHPQISCLD